MNNTHIDQCESYCSNSFSCGGFNFLHKNSQCILLLTDSISLSGIQQRDYSIFFYMQSFNDCDDDDFYITVLSCFYDYRSINFWYMLLELMFS